MYDIVSPDIISMDELIPAGADLSDESAFAVWEARLAWRVTARAALRELRLVRIMMRESLGSELNGEFFARAEARATVIEPDSMFSRQWNRYLQALKEAREAATSLAEIDPEFDATPYVRADVRTGGPTPV